LKELEGEAKMILDACHGGHGDGGDRGHESKSAHDLAKMMVAKVLYFSGGGTTDLSSLFHICICSYNRKYSI